MTGKINSFSFGTMKSYSILTFVFLQCACLLLSGQAITAKLKQAMKQFEHDEQFAHATIALTVADAVTSKPVFTHNAELGVSPASTQKVITAVTAYELLGKTFTYQTTIAYSGSIESNVLKGDLHVLASGDPSFGSWRWTTTSVEAVAAKLSVALQQLGIKAITGNIIINAPGWDTQATPGGWIWEDTGNYFGAGAWPLNWHENQYDLVLQPGNKEGDSVTILRTEPKLLVERFINELSSGKPGSGDQSIIYLGENGTTAVVRGTVPAGSSSFVVKGAVPDAHTLFGAFVAGVLNGSTVRFSGKTITGYDQPLPGYLKPLLTLSSPPLDSMMYWFLQKSINLYGEAFIKTLALKSNKIAGTKEGLEIVKTFWKEKGTEVSSLNIVDGSGLSPANRVTTNALVQVMQYAKSRQWFSSFLAALPTMNDMKMKSGYIAGVRSYTGYVSSKSGATYCFAFVINNFSGSPGTVREKMWKLLDLLK